MMPDRNDIIKLLFNAYYDRSLWTVPQDESSFDPTRAEEWIRIADVVILYSQQLVAASMPVRPQVVRALAKALEEQGDDLYAWVDVGEMTEAEADWLLENG